MKLLAISACFLICVQLLNKAEARSTLAANTLEFLEDVLSNANLIKRNLYGFRCFFGIFRASNSRTVQYFLWTRSNPGNNEFFDLQRNDESSLANSPYDGSKRTIFLIHGWMSHGLTQYILDAKDEILANEDVNIISINWETLADSELYIPSALHVFDVADYTASFLNFLIEKGNLDVSTTHIIGHSLGAHMAGITARFTNGVIDRITGLDPAGPVFKFLPPRDRIDSTSATFVDIIHTSGIRIPSLFGLPFPVGDVDFFPNGIDPQPGCSNQETNQLDLISGCSHSRANLLFVESLRGNTPFIAYPCDNFATFESGGCRVCNGDCNTMGIDANRENLGVFYLFTNAQSPFAQGFISEE